MPKLTHTRLLTAATALIVLLIACNPQLLPLVPMVDALGIDVLVFLFGAQAIATLLWMRMHAAGALRVLGLTSGAILASFVGGYLRQLFVGLRRGTVVLRFWRR